MNHLEEALRKARKERDEIDKQIAEGIAELRSLFDRRKEEDERIREPKEPTLEERNAAAKREWYALCATDDVRFRTANGKRFKVQFKCALEPASTWTDDHMASPWYLPSEYEYRIVELPAPKFVPFTRESCPIGKIFVSKTSGDRGMLIGASKESGYFGIRMSMAWDVLLKDFTMDDGSPAGMEVSE